MLSFQRQLDPKVPLLTPVTAKLTLGKTEVCLHLFSVSYHQLHCLMLSFYHIILLLLLLLLLFSLTCAFDFYFTGNCRRR